MDIVFSFVFFKDVLFLILLDMVLFDVEFLFGFFFLLIGSFEIDIWLFYLLVLLVLFIFIVVIFLGFWGFC